MKKNWSVSNFQRLGFLERVAGLDAEQRLVRLRVFVPEVVDVAGRDERQAGLRGERRELGVDARLLLETGVLDLDVDVVAAEDLRQAVEVQAASLGRFSSSALQTRPERHPESATSPFACPARWFQSTRGL